MRLYILFGQARERYEGEHAPDALDVVTEFVVDDNPGILDKLKANHQPDWDWAALEWVPLDVDGDAVRARLLPPEPKALKGKVV